LRKIATFNAPSRKGLDRTIALFGFLNVMLAHSPAPFVD